ncbi:MAG: hypothetical protein U1E76_03480 [Planctomycetota bacterium]
MNDAAEGREGGTRKMKTWPRRPKPDLQGADTRKVEQAIAIVAPDADRPAEVRAESTGPRLAHDDQLVVGPRSGEQDDVARVRRATQQRVPLTDDHVVTSERHRVVDVAARNVHAQVINVRT